MQEHYPITIWYANITIQWIVC